MKKFFSLFGIMSLLLNSVSPAVAQQQANSILANANQQVSTIISGASLPASIVWSSIASTCSAGVTPAVGSIAVQAQVLQNLPGGMICSITNGMNCTMVITFCSSGIKNNIPTQLADKSIWIGPIAASTQGDTVNAQYTNLVCATNIITNPLLIAPTEGTPIAPVSNSNLGISACYFSPAPQNYIQQLMLNPNIGNHSGAALA